MIYGDSLHSTNELHGLMTGVHTISMVLENASTRQQQSTASRSLFEICTALSLYVLATKGGRLVIESSIVLQLLI